MTGLRILVIDDSLTIRKLIEIALRGGGHTVDYAATGHAGIERAAAIDPDLVMCDYVLPDLRGNDVCRAIAGDPRSARAALVVMSGKQDLIRAQFTDVAIVEYLSKPFGAQAVVDLVDRVVKREATSRTGRETALALASSFRAALYRTMAERLMRIPGWLGELGAEAPATFFARKLFPEPVLAALFEALLPIYQQTRSRVHDPGLVADGSLGPLRPAALIALAVRTRGSHELTFQTERGTTVFFVTGGRLYTSAHGARPATEPRGLTDALHGRDGRFTWRQLDLVPPEVCGMPVHVTQLQLECLRLDDDLPAAPVHERLVRCAGFSERVRDLALSDDEQRVVTLIDGASAAGDIVRRAGGSPAAVQQAIARLIEVGLIRGRRGELGSSGGGPTGQLVVVIDPDEHGFRGPLARYLASELSGAGVVAIDGGHGLDDVLRPRPTSVIVNASAHRGLALALAELRRRSPTAPRVIAVLDDDSADAEALHDSGCAAVLCKPLHVRDLHLALVGPPATAPLSAKEP